jgi:RNA polymerase sigma-70 factor (ECF subfamily)
MRRRMDENDVAKLHRDYGYVVFRRCLVYLGEPTAAREALREVFVRAVRGAGARTDDDPRGWLCGIADELCIERLRSEQRAAQSKAASSEPQSRAIEAAVSDDDRESLLTVRRILESLELDALRLAVLYYVDELTEEELARALGLSRRALGKRLEHLLAHARGLLREERAS